MQKMVKLTRSFILSCFLAFLGITGSISFAKVAEAAPASVKASAKASANTIESRYTFPSLPTVYKDNQFREIQEAFEERVKLFLKGRNFHDYEYKKDNTILEEEFKNIKEWRNHTWYAENGDILISRPDFMVAQDLLQKGYFRRPHLIAFDYNHTDGSYNSSTIVLNQHHFLALEAPGEKTLDNFFKLLQNYNVTHLVRLTQANEKGISKSHPYWTGKVKTDPKTGQQYFKLPLAHSTSSRLVSYFPIDTWLDHEGIEPKTLLSLIEKTRKNYNPKNDLIACHCSGGVGRTGTFIAGFLLLQEIDRQLEEGISIEHLDLSIEKIVMQLSLQRAQMVAKLAQYITLHRLVDLYLDIKKKEIH